MLKQHTINAPQGLRASINHAYRQDELTLITELLDHASLTETQTLKVREQASKLVEQVRQDRKKSTGIDSFLSQYSLSSDEGIAMMCLAEALLRVPDNDTIDQLIKDKLSTADWESHRGQSDSFFVNATTWALMLTGKVLTPEKADTVISKALMKFVNRSGEGVIRKAVDTAMRIMSKQFVMGRTIKEALKRAKKKEAIGYRYSYDMLGEAALTHADAERYFIAYQDAIEAIGSHMTAALFLAAGYRLYWLWDPFVTPLAPKKGWSEKLLGDVSLLAIPAESPQPGGMVEVFADSLFPKNTAGFEYLRSFRIPPKG